MSAPTNQFFGLSTLRKEERAKQPKSEQAKALEAYLKKYTADDSAGGTDKPKKKKKKVKSVSAARLGVQIIDKDATGFQPTLAKPRTREELEAIALSDGEEEDAPVIANPGEAELYAKLVEKEKTGAAYQNWAAVDEPSPSDRALSDASPPGRGRHDTPDASPPRRGRHDTPDASPPRRGRHDTPDASPPRRRGRHDGPDASPPRRVRHDTPDASPPRRARHDSPDSHPRRRAPSLDASPPRRARGQGVSSDMSPPRKRAGGTPDSDVSPPRKRSGIHKDSQDVSPPRRNAATETARAGKKHKIMSDGTAAGMVSGKDLAAEMVLKRANENRKLEALQAASGGRDAKTVYRDKVTGQRMNKEEFMAAQMLAAEKAKPKMETPEWGGGIKQIRDREERSEDMRREAAKPFARTRDDVDREMGLRDQARFGDPMAHLVKRKEAAPPPPVMPAHMAKQLKKSGFIIPQEVPAHSWLNRRMGPPMNRYGIRPGRHWDGVDRSNGFEQDMFKMQASRAAMAQEARMFAQEDM